MVRRLVSGVVIATLAGLATACGDGGTPGGGEAAVDSPEALWAAYTSTLPKADAEKVCALFTKEGTRAFASAWGAGDCAGATDKAAAEVDDPAAWADDHRSPRTKDEDGGDFIKMTDCAVGALTAKRADGGWLISDYRHPETIGYCGG